MWVRPSISGHAALFPSTVTASRSSRAASRACASSQTRPRCAHAAGRTRPSVGLATDGSPAALVPLHDSSVWCAAENSHALAPSTRARNVDLRHRRHRHLLLLVFFNADNNHVSPTRAPCAHNRAAVRAADHAARAGQPPLLSVPSARRARARVARSRSASALRPTPRARLESPVRLSQVPC